MIPFSEIGVDGILALHPPRVVPPPSNHKRRRLDPDPAPLPNSIKPVRPSVPTPLTFYDRHIAEPYTLRRMRHLPGLTTRLLDLADRQIQKQVERAKDINLVSATDYFKSILGTEVDTSNELWAVHRLSQFHQPVRAWAEVLCLAPVSCNFKSAVLSVVPGSGSRAFWDLDLSVERPQDWPAEVISSVSPAIRHALDMMYAHDRRTIMAWNYHLVDAFQEIFSFTRQPLFPWIAPGVDGNRCGDCRPDVVGAIGAAPEGHSHDTLGFILDMAAPNVEPTLEEMLGLHRISLADLTVIGDGPDHKPNGVTVPQKRSNLSTESCWPNVSTGRGDDGDYEIYGRRIVQKAWSRAIKSDLTFFVINLGNVEYICVRFRETGEMGLSSPIVPYKHEQYSKLQLGLWTASFLDTVERWQEHTGCRRGECLKGASPSGSFGGTVLTSAPQGDRNNVPSDNSAELSAGTTLSDTLPDSMAGMRNDEAQQSFPEGHDNKDDRSLTLASTLDEIHLSLHYGKYHSPHGEVFRRWKCPPDSETRSPRSPLPPQPHSKAAHPMHATLDAPIGRGAVGIAHPAILRVGGAHREMQVIVKLGLKPEQHEDLKHESTIYSHLDSKQVAGIPRAIGLFQSTDGETMALILTDEDDLISTKLSSEQKRVFRETLGAIHEAGVVHRDIREPNLLLTAQGVPRIVDFDQAWLGKDAKEQAEDRMSLRGVFQSL